jgi:beta-lactamase regulating signal transducer with metallopeptidase domain
VDDGTPWIFELADEATGGATAAAGNSNEGKDIPLAEEGPAPHDNASSPAATHNVFRDVPLSLWLQVLWLGGALILALCYGWRTLHFARHARAGQPAPVSLDQLVTELAALLRVRPPLVRVLADLPSPVVYCLRRPVLLWPAGLEDQLHAGGCRAVLVHELAHLRRRDHWARWLELAAAILHWWNPLYWFVRRQLRFHAELACDAWVTGTLPNSRRDYAEALLEVCARFSRPAAPSPAVGVGGDGRRDFRRRLTMIMREQKPCRLAIGAKLAIVLLLLAALPAWSLGQGKTEPRPEPRFQQVIELQGLKLELAPNPGAGGRIQRGGADTETARKAREIEAKIADLQKQLQALKARLAAGQQRKEGALLLEFLGKEKEVKKGVFLIGPDGKGLQFKVEGSKPASLAELLILQPQRVGEKPLQGQYKVIGPDGKEIKGAKVLIVEPMGGRHMAVPFQFEIVPEKAKPKAQQPPAGIPLRFEIFPEKAKEKEAAQEREKARAKLEGMVRALRVRETKIAQDQGGAPAGKVINLTRATYPMSRDKAAALAAFLKANVKAPVLELAVGDRGLTVTTTPEAQGAIGGIARLMSEGQNRIILRLDSLRLNPAQEPKKP